MNWLKDWLVNTAMGRVTAVLAKAAGSFLLAHSGVLNQWGVTASIDPDKAALALLTGASFLYHLVVHTNDAPKPAQ